MDNKLSQDIVSFYRGWRNWTASEISWEQSRWVCIDDLASQDIPTVDFKNKDQVRHCLDTLIASAASNGQSEKTLNKLRQSKDYLEGTAERDPREYCQRFSLPWIRVSDVELLNMKSSIGESKEASEFGKQSGFSPDEIRHMMLSCFEGHYNAIKKVVPWLARPQFAITEAHHESSWTNIVTTDDGNINQILNSYKTRYANRALIHFLSIHEIIGHVLHFTQLKDRSDALAPHELIFSIHTEDAYYLEGVAQLLSAFLIESALGDPNSFDAYALRTTDFFAAVRHSNIIEIYDGRLTIDSAVIRHLDYCGGDADAVRKSYSLILGDSLFRNQILSYFTSYSILMPLLKLPISSQVDAISRLLLNPISVKDMTRLVREYEVKAANA